MHQVGDFLEGDTKAVVFVFVSQHCPVAQQYIPRLNSLYRQHQGQGIQFVAVYSNSRVNVMSMAKHAHDADIQYPAMLDYEHRLADLLDVESIPEVVILDAGLVKRYQGPVDDQFTKRGRRTLAMNHYLADALAAIVADQPVETPFVLTSGCRVERQPPPAPSNALSYYRDVAPIIQQRCQSCHREGCVAPFELMTYDDVYYNADTIAEVIEDRRMPPWHAYLEPKFGRFRHDPRLTESEVRTVLAWIRSGAPAGDPATAPSPREWPDPAEWSIDSPDFVYQMPEPFTVPKHGVLDYQFYRVKLDLPVDRWVQAIEVKPGNSEVVHHIAVHAVKASDKDFSGLAGMIELYGYGPDQSQLIGDYVPGDPYCAVTYPTGQAMRLPRGTDLIYELHYTPNNRAAAADQSLIAIRWASESPAQEIHSSVFRKPCGRFEIPPGEHHFRMEDSYYFPQDVEIDAIRAHFHLRGKSYRLEIVQRDEATGEVTHRETLMTIPTWDLDWQRTYQLETPLRLTAGTELRAIGHFDNSALEPEQPRSRKYGRLGSADSG